MARAAVEWHGSVELELAGDNGEKWEGGHQGGGHIYKGWVPSMRNKESTPILSLI
jgi:hypothetical protein